MIQKINRLLTYALERDIIDQRDCNYYYNQLCYLLDVTAENNYQLISTTEDIDWQLDQLVEEKSFPTLTEKELFKSKLIGTLMAPPSVTEAKFKQLYKQSPSAATNFFYQYAQDVNYIKVNAIAKNIGYKVDSEYGPIEITINLSKPEKSIDEINALKNAPVNNWPSCFLCIQQEGLYGGLTNPDRSNHRMIEIELTSGKWYFQYSPFSYFAEHGIVLSADHYDMKIDGSTFTDLIELVDYFPEYTFGSNADLPIVGGSMLTHNHYQCGKYEFPLFKAKHLLTREIGDVRISTINWPMHTLVVSGVNKHAIHTTCEHILAKWQGYSDPENNIINFTDNPHNTITPIFRKVGNVYYAYLILRNNRTTSEYPTGIYHVHAERHHVKKENIGLIEAMGLAVLPARLKSELRALADCTESIPANLSHHHQLFTAVKDYSGDKYQRLLELAGLIFVEGLVDCGVFRYDLGKFDQFLNDL